jgi:hypothetical protein
LVIPRAKSICPTDPTTALAAARGIKRITISPTPDHLPPKTRAANELRIRDNDTMHGSENTINLLVELISRGMVVFSLPISEAF